MSAMVELVEILAWPVALIIAVLIVRHCIKERARL